MYLEHWKIKTEIDKKNTNKRKQQQQQDQQQLFEK